jgi:hypothetical protein
MLGKTPLHHMSKTHQNSENKPIDELETEVNGLKKTEDDLTNKLLDSTTKFESLAKA